MTETFGDEDSSMPYETCFKCVFVSLFWFEVTGKVKRWKVFVCRLYIVVSHWCYCINKWTPLSGPPKNLTDHSYLMAVLSSGDSRSWCGNNKNLFTHYNRHTKWIVFMVSRTPGSHWHARVTEWQTVNNPSMFFQCFGCVWECEHARKQKVCFNRHGKRECELREEISFLS